MKVVCVTGFKRPEYFRLLLQSLVLNDLSGWTIRIRLEPSQFVNDFKEAARQLLPSDIYQIYVNSWQLGVRLNPFHLINDAFREGAETVIYLEEDIVISSDVTSLANWYAENYRSNWLCVSLITGGCGSKGFISYENCEDLFFESKAFNSLGFVIVKDSWKEHFQHRWLIDYPGSKDYENNMAIGWDWSIYHYLCRHENLYCLSPVSARATHIGRENGVHCTEEWHDLAFEGMFVANQCFKEPKVVLAKDLPPAARRHALMWQQLIESMIHLSGPVAKLSVVDSASCRATLKNALLPKEFVSALALKFTFFAIKNTKDPRFAKVLELLTDYASLQLDHFPAARNECEVYFRNGGVFFGLEVTDRFADRGLVGCAMTRGSTIDTLILSPDLSDIDVESDAAEALRERLKRSV